MIILFLILSHMVADFLLQPTSLVKKKFEGWLGIFIHVVIHALVLCAFLSPYLLNAQIYKVIAFIASSHFLVDTIKVHYEKKHQNFSLSYWLDQLAHFTFIIIGFELFIKGERLLSYTHPAIILYLILAIFVTLTYEIGEQQQRRSDALPRNFKLNLNKKMMLKRLVLFSFSFFLTYLLSQGHVPAPLS